jgi:serine protease
MAKFNLKSAGAVAAAIALIAGVLVMRGETPAVAEPEIAAPVFDDVGLFEPPAPVDDGYNRLLVSLPADAGSGAEGEVELEATATSATTAPAAPITTTTAAPITTTTAAPITTAPAARADEAGPDHTGLDHTGADLTGLDTAGFDLSLLDPSHGTATVMVDDAGHYWALYDDGAQIALSPGAGAAPVVSTEAAATTVESTSTTTTTEPAPEIPTGPFTNVADLTLALEADPMIESITVVDDTTVAVVTSYSEDELADVVGDLNIIIDEPVAAFETDPYFSQQWGLENDGSRSGSVADADIDVTDAWAASTGGEGVIIAVLDTGVDFSHPDLAESRWTNPGEICGNSIDDDTNGYVDDCYGWDFIDNDSLLFDGANHFHGTHVAGISGARVNNVGIAGVAPRSTIMDVRVLGNNGSGNTSGIAAGIRYAVSNGADVINVSLGAQPGLARSSFYPVEMAIQFAQAQGVIVVAAAGNSNVNIEASAVWPASFAAYYDNVIAVAATDHADRRSSFSNYGAATVGIAAPGSSILSTMPNGAWSNANGTSMAAPMVAGAAALVVGDQPNLTAPQSLLALTNAADYVPVLSGQIAQSIRLNVGNLYAERSTQAVDISATGLDQLTAGQPLSSQLTVKVNDTSTFAGREFVWEARLLTAIDGVAMGVVEHRVNVNGLATTTDASAAVQLAAASTIEQSPDLVGRGASMALGTTLPSGTYALIIEAVAADSSVIDASTNALYFVVDEPPAAPTTTSAAPVTPTTIGGGNPTPVPTTTPTGPAPTTPVTPTTIGGGTPTPVPTTTPSGPVPTTPVTPTTSPVTTSPVTTSPVTTSPVTTSPVTTTPTGPVPTTSPVPNGPVTTAPQTTTTMAPVVNDNWRVDRITPNEGFVNTTGMVTLYGQFPRSANVWFGDAAANTLFSAPDVMMVAFPRTTRAGLVDVRLVDETGTVLTVPDGFLFVESFSDRMPTTTIGSGPAPTTPGSPATTVPSTPTPTTGPGSPSTTIAGSPGTTIAAPPTTTSPGGGSPATSAPTPTTISAPTTTTPERTVPSRFAFGDAVDAPNGLKLAPLSAPSNPTPFAPNQWASNACVSVACRATEA